jgi:hypothetical protein
MRASSIWRWSIVESKKGIISEDVRPRVTEGARQVLPGIEPGLPEDTDMIRIRSDNRYTTKPLNWLFLMKRVGKVTYMK